MRVHVLGAGSVGSLLAFYLAKYGAEVTLLLRCESCHQGERPEPQVLGIGCHDCSHLPNAFPTSCASRSEERARQFHEQDSCLKLDVKSADGAWRTLQQRVGAEASTLNPASAAASPIDTLLVATKAQHAAPALSALSRRLAPSSVVVLTPNGQLGVVSDVLRAYPGQTRYRPAFVLSSLTHGVYRKTDWHFVHAGKGDWELGMASNLHLSAIGNAPIASAGRAAAPSLSGYEPARQWQDIGVDGGEGSEPGCVQRLFAFLRGVPELGARVGVPPADIMRTLHRKLAINCCINPLTALLGCRNGGLVDSPAAAAAMASLAAECFQTLGPQRLGLGSAEELAAAAAAVARGTALNTSSMLADMQQGRQTEIDYLNGYVARLAAQQGQPAPVNAAMLELVRAKQQLATSPGSERND